MTPEQRGDLAERMVYKAARLAAVVHGDGGATDVANLIEHLTVTELRGLAVVLAAMVNPDATASELLAHVKWDEQFRPVANVPTLATLRQMAHVRRLANGEAA